MRKFSFETKDLGRAKNERRASVRIPSHDVREVKLSGAADSDRPISFSFI
jgi:predicted DNA binding CopG/RHH family protein